MLAKHPIDVMLTAPDLAAVKEFYGDRVGLDVLIESDDFVTFRCAATAGSWSPGPVRRAASSRPRRAGG
jgi:hypothetical protein